MVRHAYGHIAIRDEWVVLWVLCPWREPVV